MLAVEMLPANHGDALWIEYGPDGDTHNVLIDGGPPYARKALEARLARGGGRVELLVISHLDFDHIGGILSLLARLPADTDIAEVWFNGWCHLPGEDDKLGAVQGEMVSAAIIERALPWNKLFDDEAVAVKPHAAPPSLTLGGGLQLTLLAPPLSALRALRPKWEREVKAAHLIPGDFQAAREALLKRERLDDLLGPEEEWDPPKLDKVRFDEDGSPGNRSSIALLAEYEGRSVLLAADSPPATLLPGIQSLCEERGCQRLPVDAVKLAHHGSKGSTSAELLEHLDCSRYLVSTNGKIFNHPSLQALARTVLHGGSRPQLLFNYRTPNAELLDDPAQRERYGYEVIFAEDGGLRVEL
jgi:hypothetical protein